MKVYLDTGVFIDYFINRSHAGDYLRTGRRGKRTPKKLQKDVVSCLSRISQKHEGFTSCLMLYELEQALFGELKTIYKGSSHLTRLIIPSALSAVIQGMTIASIYNLRLLDVSEKIIQKQLQEIRLQLHGIMGADSLHIVTAIEEDADIMISTDTHIRKLNNAFQNRRGNPIRFVDTDIALTLL